MGRIGLGEGGSDRRVERVPINPLPRCPQVDALAFGPQRRGVGRRQWRERRQVQVGAVDAGAAEAVAKDRGLGRQAMERGGHELVVALDPLVEIAQQFEAGTAQILGLDRRRIAAGDEHRPAQDLGAVARADQAGAVSPQPRGDRHGD
jgi:hypothetical protein